MTRLLPLLSPNPVAGEDIPDYFGQAFTFGVEACYQSCIDNDVARFKKLFPSVFIGSMVAFNTTREDTKDWQEQSKIVFSSEPLTDLLEISGYALIYSELYQNKELWDVCKHVWNKYMDQDETEQMIRLIVSTKIYRDSLFLIMPKGILRTNWEIRFRNKMIELGLMSQDDIISFKEQTTVKHQSDLIKILASRGGLLSIHPIDIFFIDYLKTQPAARGIDFPEDKNGLEEKLKELRDAKNKINENN